MSPLLVSDCLGQELLLARTLNIVSACCDAQFSFATGQKHHSSRLSPQSPDPPAGIMGDRDARRTLRHPEMLNRANHHAGVFTFDLAVDGRE
jgi:hypothetical protein